jgi:phenylalanyl-tRNA synthetase alpha chain
MSIAMRLPLGRVPLTRKALPSVSLAAVATTSTASFPNTALLHFRQCRASSTSLKHRKSSLREFSLAASQPANLNDEALKKLLAESMGNHPDCNIPTHIAERVLMEPKLYQISPHPLYLIKKRIEDYFQCVPLGNQTQNTSFVSVDSKFPIVTVAANFDSLLIPPDHVSRSPSDTYYVNDQYCLRCHTSAHQVELLQQGHSRFLCTGDVFRRDDIDRSHYPIFHQMEGVKVFDDEDSTVNTVEEVLEDLKHTLEGLAKHLFGSDAECRWVEEYFPFTHPSLELEVKFDDEWMEVLGCGVMRPEILQEGLSMKDNDNLPLAWAFGLGLERLAMILFQIPDIRLFWSQDERFWKQFSEDMVMDGTTTFQPYSKYPPVFKDVSFWLLQDEHTAASSFHVNELLDLVRGVAGDLVENVEIVDQFVHPKTGLESHCYRITYRSMDRSLTNEEIDGLQEELRNRMSTELNQSVELR